MGRGPTNENTNMYFQARKKAATYNERLWSREGAAELLGISVSTLADYELGNTKVVPVDKVVLMADLYNAPECKIAMAEAESEGVKGKALVMLVVLNRVWSDEFPDTIEEVIFQKNQFSPVANGRYDAIEPDEECYEALGLIQVDHWNESQDALYFESKSDSKWHSENLEFLFKYGKHYFYK